MSDIFVSTGAFKPKEIKELLKLAEENDIYNIELSSGLNYDSNTKEIIKNSSEKFKFLIHNYFPAPKEPFVLNLASKDKQVIENSMNLCKNAIDMISELGGEFYSVHCGFTFDCSAKELGNNRQMECEKIAIEEAYNNFVKNIKELSIYSQKKNIKLAIENNVFAEFAYTNGCNNMYLGADIEGLKKIFKDVKSDNLYLLLDLAHAKISSTFLNFNIDDLIKELKDKIIAVHISENDGKNDNNFKISSNSELIKYIHQLKNKVLVIESYNLEVKEIRQQINILEEIKYDKQ